MKRLLCYILILLTFCGCEKKEDKIEISFDDTYYSVVSPYKEAIGSYSIRSYDKSEVETMLMNISSDYFKTNNSLYQEGQYLTSEEIKELVTKYNQIEELTMDNISIQPQYITTIYEQNYLATNNHLKGISLAIVLDNKQYYEQNAYKLVSEDIVLEHGKKCANELLNYMRSKEELANTKIVIGIYLQNNDNLKGGFKYVGSTEKEDIHFDYVDYHYQLLDSNYVMNHDSNTYNHVLALKNSLKEYNVYTNVTGLYKGDTLLNITITINRNYFNQGEILNISKIITENIANFDSNITIKVYLKSNNVKKAFLNKKSNANKIETYILEE